MRTVAFLALMVAPAMGFSMRDVLQNKVEADELPQVRGSVRDQVKTVGVHRALKGSKGSKGGKGGKGSKGSVAVPVCETIAVYTLQQDYTKNGALIGDFGEALEGLPLYEQKTNRIIATITETVIDAGQDCTAVGSINFGLRNAQSGRTKNQLMYQGTCTGGLTNGLTGGTGTFAGAKGLMEFTGQRPNKFFFHLLACDATS